MNGYLVNLFKYPPADVESIRKGGALQNQIATDDYSLIRNVVWSNLDRIEVRIINNFGDYRSADKSEKSWIGERQFAMLYDLVEESKLKLKYREDDTKEDHCRFRFEPVENFDLKERDEYRFFGISMINFSPTMHEYFYRQENSGTVIHQEMSKILEGLCSSQSAHFLSKYLNYEIYGTLGSADCAIIWLVNQYTDVIALLEALKKIKCTEKEYVISNVYTIMGLSNPVPENKNIFKGSKGIFHLRLIQRGSFDIDSFKAELSRYISSINDINIVLGKYDVSVTFESSNITENIYADDKPIHFRSEKYYPIILEAYTELMQKSDADKIEPINYDTCKNITEISAITNTDCFEKIRDLIDEVIQNEIFVNMSYLKETLWLLYQDFIKNMASEFSYPWTIDLGYAFQKSIEYMQEILKEENGISKNEAISFIENFIDSIRQMILHISQASKLYFEIPNSHLKQTGAYSKVLSSYYGIIKGLLKISYALPKCNMQSEIIPFITFDVKPKVESVFFETLKVQEKRVVNFQMPYEALTDVSKYSKLLAHEVFHYITPERRDMRNHLYGCIIWTEIIKSICYQRFLSLYCALDKPGLSYDDWHIRCGEIVQEIKGDIWNIVLEKYEQLMSAYIENEWCLWSEYYYYIDEKALMEYRIDQSCISKIYNIIKELLEDNSFLKGNNKDYQTIINTIKKDLKDNKKFISWYLSTDVLTRLGTKATDIIDAHREAFADFFMIQVMKLDMKEYLSMIFNLGDIYEPNDQMHMMQMFRVGMVIDYIWSQNGNITDEIINENIKRQGLDEELAKRLRDLWKEYKKYAMLYRNVFHYLFKSMDLNEMEESQYTELFDSLNVFQNKVVQYTLSQSDKNFEGNYCIIENMQHQAPLEKIFDNKYLKNGDRRQLKTFKSEKNEFRLGEITKCEDVIQEGIYKSLPVVQSLEEFMKTFEIIAKELQDDHLEPLWFRGHGSSEYKLIPSLYRMKDCTSHTYHTALRTIMEELLTAFRVKAFHVPEIFPKGNDSTLGTMVSMQHYGVETNLMDWSQQIFSALYFALEKYIDNPDEKTPEVNARVYILNPARFNIMMKKILGLSVVDGHYAIPALLQEDDKYARYFPFVSVKSGGTDGEDKNNYPFAIYTPYVNPRIKAQAGCFTIFSINASGVDENGECSYMRFELEELQNECQKTKDASYKPFLGYIDIDKEYVISIANNIRTMGITKQYIYPELSVIAKEIKDEIKWNYLNKNE